jgi:hypothetical protein
MNEKLKFYSFQNDNIPAIINKSGIRIKDQIIKNCNNNIKIYPQQINNNKIEIKKTIKQKYIFEEGEYEGEIQNGIPHGIGIFKYKNGDEYNGEFKEGLFDGQGQHISKKKVNNIQDILKLEIEMDKGFANL